MEYFRFGCRIVGIDEDALAEPFSQQSVLAAGKALSPVDAARCVWQSSRTTKFIKGIDRAVQDLRERFPGETLNVLYAGCGPLAPLAMPLLARHGWNDLRFTLLDIHSPSLEGARKMAQTFCVDGGIHRWVLGDAAEFSLEEEPYHLIISEVLQQALQNEPQVAVTRNLVNFLRDGGIFIPEEITVSLKFYDIGGFHSSVVDQGAARADEWSHMIGEVFTLTVDTARSWEVSASQIPAATIFVPPAPTPRSEIFLFTDLRVYGTHTLRTNESSLNIPVVVDGVIKAGSTAEFFYEIGREPGLRLRNVR